ncbi:MAG: hypothetical protein RI907_191 [Pseudomonadota bacterium]
MTADRSQANVLVDLNRTEHMFWATEGYIGGIIQPYLLRLEGHVDEARVRRALRELTSAHPRLRGVIVPTGTTYKLRILPDDRLIDQLVEGAFKVDHGVDLDDPTQVQAWHTRVLNEPIQLERGLPWKARWIAHPTRPALIFALHHIVGDGRSLIGMITDILGHLSDQPIAQRSLQATSMVPSFVPKSLAAWPASIAGWWRNSKKDQAIKAGAEVITLATRRSTHFTTSTIRHHLFPCTPAQVKALSKQMGTTVNTLLTAVIANTFLAQAQGKPGATAGIRISFDLRRHFPEGTAPEVGNFVSSFAVYARPQPDLKAQIAAIDAQVKDNIARYERREYALPLLLFEALPLLGRRLFSKLILNAKEKGKIPPMSCHFSNLGMAEAIQPKDAKVRIAEVWPVSMGTTPVFGLVTLGDKVLMACTTQDDETDVADVEAFLHALDGQLRQLIAA